MLRREASVYDCLMPTYRMTARAAAPPERVFDLWTDLDRMKELVGGVTTAGFPDALRQLDPSRRVKRDIRG
jgi:hypothetical protein